MTEQPPIRDRITLAISVLEAIEGEIRDDVLPEWFRHEWLHDELVPVLREALKAIPVPPKSDPHTYNGCVPFAG